MSARATPHDSERPIGVFPRLILPDVSRIFLDQSKRFGEIAQKHSLAEWLSFLSRLTSIQHELLQEYPLFPLPDQPVPASDEECSVAPIAHAFRPRNPSWRQALATLARELEPHATLPARPILKGLQEMDSSTLEALADRVLQVELGSGETGSLPFVAAALQVHWTALASRLDGTKIGLSASPNVCPCCGFAPVAGLVRTDGETARLRYLHCALCNTEWHMVRAICTTCFDSNRLASYHIDGSDTSVRAETCDACGSYLKVLYREKSPQADPVADDLSTLALDLLVEEAGYGRMSTNLLFAPFLDAGSDTKVNL